MNPLKPILSMASILLLLSTAACNRDDAALTPTTTISPTGTVSATVGPQVKYEKFGLSVNVPKGVEIVENGLIQKEPTENSGKIEWGDAGKDGLVSVFWMRGMTRETYDVGTGTSSLANSYHGPPIGIVSNLSEIERTNIGNFEADVRTYEFEFFQQKYKGLIVAIQCLNPDALFFLNAIHKELPLKEIIERVLLGFSCK